MRTGGRMCRGTSGANATPLICPFGSIRALRAEIRHAAVSAVGKSSTSCAGSMKSAVATLSVGRATGDDRRAVVNCIGFRSW